MVAWGSAPPARGFENLLWALGNSRPGLLKPHFDIFPNVETVIFSGGHEIFTSSGIRKDSME
jgi:hypothetical protein